MNTTISKWGNSLGIRIPNIATKHWSLKNGDILDIEIHEDEIVIKKPRKKTAKDIIAEFYHKPYAEVLAMANSGQIEQDTELDWGEDVGNEALE
ncbi:MAG: AbrB/MazE/SpoVT family DNA-binding domain-containing protein [Lachnospiraceae bacterium]|nr:AbrB/MazE/SpoVT family DNA-binding domain-containing protein [Lachnospiraceae bacterium]